MCFCGQFTRSFQILDGRIILYGDYEDSEIYRRHGRYDEIYIFSTSLNSSAGTISQNSVLDNNKMVRITQLIQESLGYSFIPTGVFTATWDAVPYYSESVSITE